MRTDVQVYFGTNRNQFRANNSQAKIYVDKIAFGSDLSGFDGQALRFGKAAVSFSDDFVGAVTQVNVAAEDVLPSSANSRPRVGSREIYDELRRAALSSPENIIVVLHGYANSFESGLTGAAELGGLLDRPNVFTFCWPSGEIAVGLNYGHARKMARTSGDAIGRAFDILLRMLGTLRDEDRCHRKVDIIAHSMGNYALRQAVQRMKPHLETPAGNRLFDDLLLVAADDDNDTLERDDGIAPLLPHVRAATVYYSRWDLALQYSDRVKFNPDRLGQYGPRNLSVISEKVVAVDVTETLDQDDDILINHWYHRSPNSRTVLADMKRTLEFRGADPADPSHFPNRKKLDTGPRRYRLMPA